MGSPGQLRLRGSPFGSGLRAVRRSFLLRGDGSGNYTLKDFTILDRNRGSTFADSVSRSHFITASSHAELKGASDELCFLIAVSPVTGLRQGARRLRCRARTRICRVETDLNQDTVNVD
jgi:hypothetical protein